ncbi:MAG: hypothetical protein GTN76_13330, partial [Candidatus Aenigmarchaeota archaeon]|nr:hypothetical protein [Candidatus Aenigmarchaeota archaeon]
MPAQILKSVAMDIPTVLLLRNPEEAVASWLVFQSSLNADIYLKAYIKFYNAIVPLLDRLIVSDFPTTTGDFNKVIQTTNNRYGTTYEEVTNLKERQVEIFEILKGLNERFFSGKKNKELHPDE